MIVRTENNLLGRSHCKNAIEVTDNAVYVYLLRCVDSISNDRRYMQNSMSNYSCQKFSIKLQGPLSKCWLKFANYRAEQQCKAAKAVRSFLQYVRFYFLFFK